MSASMSGEQNPMFGKQTPTGAGNGWSGWYKDWYFRSLGELSYVVNVLHEPIDDVPCPFCRTDEFIELDHFCKVDSFLDEMMEDDSPEQYDIHIDEATEKARGWYLKWIDNLRSKY